MQRAGIFLLSMMTLLLCGTVHGNELPGELEKRVEATEKETDDLRERLQTLETDEGCVRPTDRGTWEEFFDELDRHNGDQVL